MELDNISQKVSITDPVAKSGQDHIKLDIKNGRILAVAGYSIQYNRDKEYITK